MILFNKISVPSAFNTSQKIDFSLYSHINAYESQFDLFTERSSQGCFILNSCLEKTKGFLPYIGRVAILVSKPESFEHTFIPPVLRGLIWYMVTDHSNFREEILWKCWGLTMTQPVYLISFSWALGTVAGYKMSSVGYYCIITPLKKFYHAGMSLYFTWKREKFVSAAFPLTSKSQLSVYKLFFTGRQYSL